jgi:hypothetical protein
MACWNQGHGLTWAGLFAVGRLEYWCLVLTIPSGMVTILGGMLALA